MEQTILAGKRARMKNANWYKSNAAPDVVDPSIALLTYKQVKEMFGWTDNAIIRLAVKRGDLVRVRINTNKSGWRITAESALKFRQQRLEEAEAAEVFGYTPEQLRQLAMAKKRQDATKVAVEAPNDDEIRAAEKHAEAVRQMNEHNERAAREHFAANHNLDYWLKKVGYIPPVKNGTPDEINAAFIAEENAKAPIWVGDVAFHGVDEYGRTAEARASAYIAELEERRKPKPGFYQQRGI